MVRLVNEYLPRINFLLLIILVAMIGIIGFDYFKSKKENQEAIRQFTEIVKTKKEEGDNKIIIVSKDGIFQVLEGKEVSIESLSPLIVKYQDNVFRKDGTFYLYTKGNVIYVFDMHNKSIIGAKRGE
ncbi:MAG: hypothetical protein JHC31_08420 [Sulfurihydrogenibium sp.]|nr:hypothetical protein [Sulfurihydrogenibium sp.]